MSDDNKNDYVRPMDEAANPWQPIEIPCAVEEPCRSWAFREQLPMSVRNPATLPHPNGSELFASGHWRTRCILSKIA